jgi:serine/threonine protein kinase/tetratricopeptide (TPR) repeat protein
MIGTTLSHYCIVEKIGEGGMGEVYRAHDESLDRDVAVKVLPDEVAEKPDRLARFEREARAVAKLNHPNILDVYELGDHEGRPFMAMELLEGETLRDRLDSGTLDWRKATEIGAAVADGLGAAHEAGICHRDLKPSNVFLTVDGRVKILDFGLARSRDAAADKDVTHAPTITRQTDPGTVVGTIGYMSPEQVRAEPVDQRSDIFSLGCVLYEMVLGRRAFARDTAAETMTAILREPPGDFEFTDGGVPQEIRRIITRCLEKNPEERFQSARDLAFNLRSVATQDGGAGAGRRPAANQKKWWIAVGGLVVVIAAVVTWRLALQSEGPSPAGGIPRIVVLPFENLGSPDDEYFADGITEEITSRLTAVSGLQVISRISAVHYRNRHVPIKQIGEELDVGYVLEGTIRWDRSGSGHGRVRVTPQLIRVADDSHLWSERYDRMLEDIFSVQSDIAERVIDQLEVTLLETERDRIENLPTQNMEAYQAYLAGIRYVHGSRDEKYTRLSIEMFERAVQLDPGFAVAHAALSTAHTRLHHYRYDFTTERLDKGKQSAERALELQPDLPDAHRALGWYYYWGHRDYDRALEHFEMSAEKAPNDPELLLGTFAVLRRQGRWDDAFGVLERLRRADPQSYGVALESSSTFAFLRNYERAQKEIRRAIAIAPDHPDAYSEGGLYYLLWDGDTDRARLLLESAPNKDSPEIIHQELLLDLYDRKLESVLAGLEKVSIAEFSLTYWYVPKGLLECTVLSRMNERKRADSACAPVVELLEREIEATPHDFLRHIALGHTYALLGRSEEAIRAGERAVELMPISKDAMDGPDQVIELAKIYTQVGEVERALDLIEELLSIPSMLSVGLLRLDPVWDPLRDDPRFQALLKKNDTN